MDERHQDLRFDFEALRTQDEATPGGQVDQTKATLGVGQVAAGTGRDAVAHPAVDQPSHRWHGSGIAHAIAYNQRRTCIGGAAEELRDIAAGMLAVTIHRQGPGETLVLRGGKAS
jgi:hypothetical protein